MIYQKCRQCGEAIDFRRFGPGKTCPNCGKDTAPVDIKEVHVELSYTRWGDPSKLYREMGKKYLPGIDYINLFFNLELCIGDISSAPYSNRFVYAHECCSCKSIEKSIDENIKKLSQAGNNAIIYLWINERDVNAYINLLKYADLFKRFEQVYLIRCCSEEDEKKADYEPNDSFAQKKRLSCDDLESLSAKYSEVLALGGDYRLGAFGEIIPYSAKDLETLVMGEINETCVGYTKVYDKARRVFEKTFGYVLHDGMFREIIWNLMIKKQIRAKGPFAWWGEFSIYGCTGFCLDKQSVETNYTYDDALLKVRDAFEIGFTLPLYELIAEETYLNFKDSSNTYRGKKEIIEFIEEYGATRVNLNNEIVQGHIVKVTEGKSLCIGERCVLIEYSKESEDVNNCILLRVDFQDNRIQKIQLVHVEDIEKPCGFEVVEG